MKTNIIPFALNIFIEINALVHRIPFFSKLLTYPTALWYEELWTYFSGGVCTCEWAKNAGGREKLCVPGHLLQSAWTCSSALKGAGCPPHYRLLVKGRAEEPYLSKLWPWLHGVAAETLRKAWSTGFVLVWAAFDGNILTSVRQGGQHCWCRVYRTAGEEIKQVCCVQDQDLEKCGGNSHTSPFLRLFLPL